MENLEHNIKKAFAENDAKTIFSGKEKMWHRIEPTIHKRNGVVPFWRAAAVFLVLLLAAGVYASLNNRMKQQQNMDELRNENTDLRHTIDSLLTRPAEVKTETKVVEKVVYRDRLIQQNKNQYDFDWQKKYEQLQDSTKNILAAKVQIYKAELKQVETELATLKSELSASKQNATIQNQQNENPPFQLKGGRVELDVPKTPNVKSPEMELKVFPKNFPENNNNLNKTLLKNK